MRSYCTLTSGKTLAQLCRAGWGIVVTPEALKKNRPAFQWSQAQSLPMRYVLDNGAWTAFQKGAPWDSQGFIEMTTEIGNGCDFAVLPDIVEGGLDSLRLSLSWAEMVSALVGVCLIPVQDGMVAEDLRKHLSPSVGIFVGGSTEWKEKTLRHWAALAQGKGALCHVGRVNTVRRIALCTNAGVSSIDGTSVARFAQSLGMLDSARKQMSLLGKITENKGG